MISDSGTVPAPDLSLLAINLTRRCNLACAHCYLDAQTLRDGDDDEMETARVKALLDDVAALGHGTMIVLTGGEPLLRRDLEEIVAHGSSLNLPIVIGTNAMMLTERRIAALGQAGLLGFGISLDSLDPGNHDRFRGQSGAWVKTLAGIERCRRYGIDFQLHFSVTDDNAHELPAMIEFARTCGARALNVFFMVCIGRARSLAMLKPDRYERFLQELVEAQARYPDLIVRPRCAPHFKRVAHQLRPEAPVNRISGRESDGCIAGIHYARVNHRGAVTPCPYVQHEVGNIRETPLSELWAEAPTFAQLRAPDLSGKCGVCEYRLLCGGCRARAFSSRGSLMADDDLCAYEPRGGDPLQPLADAAEKAPRWSQDAELRLSRVPVFLRQMVRKRTEAYVTGLGADRVTCQHLADLAAARFGASPAERFAGRKQPVDCAPEDR
ncbi:MAG: radical SAM protein [Gammaproteobacteria bacterium]|jgi:radical SAM protein with 4Fe4S-binding SPASM domain|nr:radical SAM protein [Gammaproteobacteria bacterium]